MDGGVWITLVSLLLLMWTMVTTGQQHTYCTPYPTASSSSDPKLPVLQNSYSTKIEANILDRNYSMTAFENFDYNASKAAVQVVGNGTIYDMIFDYKNNQLLYIVGTSCTVTDLTFDNNNELFGNIKVNGTVHIFTSAGALHFAKSYGEKYMGKTTVRGIKVDHWKSCLYWPDVSSNFTLDYYFTSTDWLNPIQYPQIPVRAVASGVQLTAQGVLRNFTHYYDYIDFQLNVTDPTVFETPSGVVCKGQKQTRALPKVPEYFHFRQEIIDNREGLTVQTLDAWYDGQNKLTRVDYSLQQAVPPLNTLNPITEITDFNYGITYFIDQSTGECGMAPALAYHTLNKADNLTFIDNNGSQILYMKDPQQFFQIDSSYTYTGQRTTRGLLCDVFISVRTDFAVQGVTNSQAVFEYYFLADGYTEHPDIGVSTPKDVPVLLMVTIDALGIKVQYNFMSFDLKELDLSAFDVSACYPESAKLQLTVKFFGQASPFIAGNLKYLAWKKLATSMGISPVRVQEVAVNYDQSFVYVSAKVLDRSNALAQFSHTPIHMVHIKPDQFYSYLQISTPEDCAAACIQSTNFTCNTFDLCTDDRFSTCRLYKELITNNSHSLFPGACNHYSRIVTAPTKPELDLTSAYNNLTTQVYAGSLFVLVFTETQVNPLNFQAIDVSVTSGQLYHQGLQSLQTQFSYHLENSIPKIKQVVNSQIWYDYLSKIVRYDVLNLVPTTYIHDYNSGLSYTIVKNIMTCTVGPIGNDSFDVLAPTGSQLNQTGYILKMKNPLQLFDLSNNYVYTGQKTVRNMLCDAFENVGKFNFGGQPKDAIFQFYFASTGWHELSFDSGAPVPHQPISLVVTAVDGSDLEHYDISDFSQQHPDLSNFNIQPCFPQDQQKHFLIIFNQTYHPTLDHNLAKFQSSVLQQLSVISGVSPLRFQNPQIDYQGGSTYYIATMVEQAPTIFDFTKTSNSEGLYSMDASYTGVTSDVQCAGVCRNMSGFHCFSFDYCPSKKLCQLSKQHTPDGRKLQSSTTCDHYSRTVSSQLNVEPTVEQAFTMFLDRIARGTLVVPVQISASLVVKYPATFLDRDILRFDSGQASSETLSHFSLYKQQAVFKNIAETVTSVAVDECASHCLSEIGFDCESFTYCYRTGRCLLSDVHTGNDSTGIESSSGCDLYTRKYTDAYNLYSGMVLRSASPAYTVNNVGSPDICAQKCSTTSDLQCRSFDYCGSTRTCYLNSEHILDYNKNQRRQTNAVCSHYSKKFLYDFIKTPKRVLAAGNTINFFNVTLESCAKLCVENGGYTCKSFTHCQVDGSCVITSSQTRLSQLQIKPNDNCDLYTRQTIPNSATPGSQTSQPQQTGYNAMTMGLVAIAMLIPGMILGAGILYFIKTKKLVDRKQIHEMHVINRNRLEEQGDSES